MRTFPIKKQKHLQNKRYLKRKDKKFWGIFLKMALKYEVLKYHTAFNIAFETRTVTSVKRVLGEKAGPHSVLREFFHYLNSQISAIEKLIFRISYKNQQPHSQTLIRSISINVKSKKIKLFKQLQNQTKLSMGQIPTSNSNRKGVHYHSRKFVGQNYSEHAVGHNGISPI